MRHRVRILYCCPFSGYSGHHPHAATIEPEILAKDGVDVALVTFCGITGNPKLTVPHYKVLANDWTFLRWIRKSTIPRWFLMLIETILTIGKAMKICRKLDYDIIYLRDGEPFLFVSFLLSTPFHNHKWVISLTGANLFTPRPSAFRFLENPFIYFYTTALRIVSGRVWRPLYRWSLNRNRFMLVTQNEEAKRAYNEHQNGVFTDSVKCVPLGTSNITTPIPRNETRVKQGLPPDMLVLLSFGAPHSGKDIRTVIEAIAHTPGVFVVHAGTQSFSLGSNPENLTKEYKLSDRTKIFNCYIKEEEKPMLFSAVDALVLSYTRVFKSTSSMLWEAAKYHLPVISSNANLLGAMVKEYNLGLLFEAENVESLVHAIKRFKNLRPEEFESMESGRQRFFEDYSSEKWAKDTLEVCEQLMETK